LEPYHPIIREILNYRQLTKLKSTYADGLFEYIGKDGRIHSNFNQKTAATGRLSSTDPNLQNIPVRIEIGREIRKVFIPKKDYVFIDADYSQIELRLLAHLSGDESFINAFNNNLDIHTMTASQVFHVPFEEVTSLQRRNAKAVNFGIVYGISAFGLSQDLKITRQEAADYIDQYFAKYPKVKGFLDQTIENAKKDGYVKTMYNRIRHIPELSSSNFTVRSFGERVAMNTPIQGSAADIIKIAMIHVYDRLKSEGLKSCLILTVHDELLIETHKDEIEVVTQLLVEEMENAVHISVPLTVDAHSGNSWYEAK
ncbi:MAG: DNA polymerase I, partial [Vallitaleaceae bacterium]|nr:DNA polymerase I [Vallitaleaceae bacterium]